MYLYKLCVNELEELDFKKERKGSNQSGVWHQIERTFHFLPFAKIQNNVTIHTQQYIVILRISPKSAYLLITVLGRVFKTRFWHTQHVQNWARLEKAIQL